MPTLRELAELAVSKLEAFPAWLEQQDPSEIAGDLCAYTNPITKYLGQKTGYLWSATSFSIDVESVKPSDTDAKHPAILLSCEADEVADFQQFSRIGWLQGVLEWFEKQYEANGEINQDILCGQMLHIIQICNLGGTPTVYQPVSDSALILMSQLISADLLLASSQQVIPSELAKPFSAIERDCDREVAAALIQAQYALLYRQFSSAVNHLMTAAAAREYIWPFKENMAYEVLKSLFSLPGVELMSDQYVRWDIMQLQRSIHAALCDVNLDVGGDLWALQGMIRDCGLSFRMNIPARVLELLDLEVGSSYQDVLHRIRELKSVQTLNSADLDIVAVLRTYLSTMGVRRHMTRLQPMLEVLTALGFDRNAVIQSLREAPSVELKTCLSDAPVRLTVDIEGQDYYYVELHYEELFD